MSVKCDCCTYTGAKTGPKRKRLRTKIKKIIRAIFKRDLRKELDDGGFSQA